MNRKLIVLALVVGFLCAVPLVVSANAHVDYESFDEQPNDDVGTTGEVTPDNIGGWLAGTLAGWLAGKVYDSAWEALSNTNAEFMHLCLSLPEEKNQDIKEAFGR